jgi:hypothetical protein
MATPPPLLGRHRRGPRAGIRVHHSARPLPASQLTVRDGLTLTTPERTLLDLAALLHGRTAEAKASLGELVDDFFLREVVTPRGLAAFLEDRALRKTRGRHLLRRLVRSRRRAPPRTLPELERHVEDVLEANHLRPPEVIDEAKACSPLLGLGYGDSRVLFELSAQSLMLGPAQLARAKEARAKLIGAGWYVHPVSYEALRDQRRTALWALRPLQYPSETPRLGGIDSGLPAFDLGDLVHRMRRLNDRRRLPAALMRQGYESVKTLLDMERFEDFSPEELAELRGLIEDCNDQRPLYPDEPT